jgi:predicted amidohydrolase
MAVDPVRGTITRRDMLASTVAAVAAVAAAHGAYGELSAPPSSSSSDPMTGWTPASPRDEIRPSFHLDPKGGAEGRAALVIQADARQGLDGCWTRAFPVTGGQHYRFAALFRATNVPVPRRSIVAKLDWRDDKGRAVAVDEPIVTDVLQGMTAMAETDFPPSGPTRADGWTPVVGTYRAPAKATQAVVRLHLQWVANAQVKWSDMSLTPCNAPSSRIVRLATAHLRPTGGRVPMDHCRQYEPLIAEAARQRADLIVLGETLTYANLGKRFADVAEPVPGGPSTAYFAELARQYKLHIVPGLVERDGNLIHNSAILIDPDGQVLGKYRKVCLPRGEVDGGLAPGNDYPVFTTRFGRVGLMICYDGFFPEVARELANRGAEVIAWPVWGCNPLLARARACENHVYLVSSTYEEPAHNWMISGIFDHTGRPIAQASKWGSIAIAEVDLNARTEWPSLGDFRAHLPHHRPVAVGEPIVSSQPNNAAARL